MKKEKVSICFFLVVAMVVAMAMTQAQTPGTQVICKNDTVCSARQCCYIQPEFLVMSRRQAMPLDTRLPPVKHDTGVCENYHWRGDHCYPLEKLNGHCGCAPGMTCRWVSASTVQPAVTTPPSKTRRKLQYHPGPGSYQCV